MMGKEEKKIAAIILAAGKGTRMKSNKAKVLHGINGRPMISHVVETASKATGKNVIVVIGHQAEAVREIVSEQADVLFAYQDKQFGTGHAVMCALPHLSEEIKEVVILCGDVPLLLADTIIRLIESHKKENSDITILAVEIDTPTGYGRMQVDGNGNVLRIIEEADATLEEKKIKIINSGIYCVNKEFLKKSLSKIKSDNAQKELYLTDIIEIGHRDKKRVRLFVGTDIDEVVGVNSCLDLIKAEKLMQKRLRKIS
jgi:UDP-N-acetylglucosamine diphosphorylase/glucosamine-1-phosphate N-acetyltransferase